MWLNIIDKLLEELIADSLQLHKHLQAPPDGIRLINNSFVPSVNCQLFREALCVVGVH